MNEPQRGNKMTRKDYELLAGAIGSAFDDIEAKGYDLDLIGTAIVSRISSALALDNPRFDEKRFTRACLMTPKTVDQRRKYFENALANLA